MIWTIKSRMVVMAIAAVFGLSVLAGIQMFTSGAVKSKTTESERLRIDLDRLAQMRLANIELLLAAMDSIIDKAEGHMDPGRQESIDTSVAFIKANLGTLADLAESAEDKAQANGFAAAFDAVGRAIQVDLKNAIETNAGDEAFAALDDVIDESGEVVAGTLDHFNDVGQARFGALISESSAAVSSSLIAAIVAYCLALLALLPLLYVIARGIIRSVGALTDTMEDLAQGNLSVEVPGADNQDELGAMARAVLVFKRNAEDVQRLETNQSEERHRLEEEKRQATLALADSFEKAIAGVVADVGLAAKDMSGLAQSLSGDARSTNELAGTVTDTAQVVSSNVDSVAAAAEELSASIHEISRQVNESSTVSTRAVNQAEETNQLVQTLSEAAQRIGEVVDLINEIASQTNLLALNATIEAARAGEAGKGFAVVASEVKSLATQTARATGEIGDQVEAIRAASNNAVEAIGRIGTTIGEVNTVASTIAAAVEQQGAATSEIAGSAQSAAGGTRDVSGNITDVSDAARRTGDAAEKVLTSAASLDVTSDKLKTEVADFIKKVRAA